ncbi:MULTISPECIES: monovalent cation/H+ antiporter complex subunit F [unclassified Streptomyces]|uniref:monovalent cation/H+ antiporter complex subunit F n=1 Tax=unclassified Streptomyces TaxID=2593676 RepID=UPI0022B61E81|nr:MULTISPECIES: monovalent cation/H+ antiporter complex subunit F [unclassified Streptomyces]MCZ7414337.1 monovalent cation/H+ antiporter complex subunit F [Streptomyces sp. WMMC897]MCZ7431292.1 monovalent cation/H+ antiporter complex subunit F [Streptomyces sp. WMMC1477]
MTLFYTLAMALLAAAGGLTVVRLLRGPGALDRIVALDALITMIVAGMAVHLAANGETSVLPLLLVLSLLAFIGSVTAAHVIEAKERIR